MVEKELGQAPTAPELYPDLYPVMEAFWTLSQSRPVSSSAPGAIPVSEMLHYAGAVYVGDQQEFIELIQAADRVYLEQTIQRLNRDGHTARRTH